MIVTHRWVSLVIGVLVVIVCTSGASLVYEPELIRATHADLFAYSGQPQTVSFARAADAVHQVDPAFHATSIGKKDGVFTVSSDDADAGTWFVDAGTAHVNGHGDLDGGVLGFLVNLHDCALTCTGYPGYQSWLAAPSPIAGIPAFEAMTWGAVVLALTGVVVLFLGVTGIVIWYPGIRRWRKGFELRLDRGRFARDYDLHKVIGIVAAVPLIVWALTGMNFEVPGVAKLWYAVTGGVAPSADSASMQPSGSTAPAITIDRAVSAAEAHFPGSSATWVRLPADDTGYYSIDVLQGGTDLWRGSATYHGNRSIGIDSHDPSEVKELSGPPATLSNRVLDTWAQPMLHYGQAVNGWWRAGWFVLGLSPLALMITGLSTWLFRRKTAKRRRAAQRSRVAASAAP